MTLPEGTAYRLARTINSWYIDWQNAHHSTEEKTDELRCTSVRHVERTVAQANQGGKLIAERSPTGEETGRICVTFVLLTWWPVVHLHGILGDNNEIADPKLLYLDREWHRVRNADPAALAWLGRTMLTHTPERIRDLTQATWGYATRADFLAATGNINRRPLPNHPWSRNYTSDTADR